MRFRDKPVVTQRTVARALRSAGFVADEEDSVNRRKHCFERPYAQRNRCLFAIKADALLKESQNESRLQGVTGK
jgi:hypothetical protein